MNADTLHSLLHPYVGDTPVSERVVEQILSYLDVFQHWSTRVNLSTVRDPEQVVQRHFGEGLYLARHLPMAAGILDLGSGAGFPGIPIALSFPDADVVLAESQSKKAAFLKEVSHRMGLGVTVWAARAESLPAATKFPVVVLRAVDDMPRALEAAACLLQPGGVLAYFAGEQYEAPLPTMSWADVQRVEVPLSSGHIVLARSA